MLRSLIRRPRAELMIAMLLSLPVAGSSIAQKADWVMFPRTPQQELADHRRIQSALSVLAPQRPGTVDAYVVVVALDADPVFGREAREAGRVLARRFDAAGRTIVLAGDENADRAHAPGSPHHLSLALARAAEVMDLNEDVLVLYSTSHGLPNSGLAYRDNVRGAGVVTPPRLVEMLAPLGFRNRLLILQACYSGQFLFALAEPGTVVATASSADRSSFGCSPGNDWTLFGDSLINRALRQPAPLATQLQRAVQRIAAAEKRAKLEPSEPQISFGNATAGWVRALDARAPRTATQPVGRPPADIASLQ